MRVRSPLLVAAMLLLAAPRAAQARTDVSLSLNIGAPPVYVAPAPVYVAPAPQVIYVPDDSPVVVNRVYFVHGRRVIYMHRHGWGREREARGWRHEHGHGRWQR